MNGRIQARVTHRFAATPEAVYDAWLDPEKIRVWMSAALTEFGLSGDMRRVEVDARVGGRFLISDMRDGTEAEHWGTYLELDRPRKIVFTWIVDKSGEDNPSKVAITLERDGAGCLATLTHEMDAGWADFVDRTESGWSRMLRSIESMIDSTARRES